MGLRDILIIITAALVVVFLLHVNHHFWLKLCMSTLMLRCKHTQRGSGYEASEHNVSMRAHAHTHTQGAGG